MHRICPRSSSRVVALVILLVLNCSLAAELDRALTRGLGRAADASEAWGLTVMPGGFNLPNGSGTAAQGERLFQEKCVACHDHGGRLSLVAGRDTISGPTPRRSVVSYWPYATTIFDYIRRAMPYEAPKSLDADEVYALTAYILSEGGVVTPGTLLDREALLGVRMPNRDGFVDRSRE